MGLYQDFKGVIDWFIFTLVYGFFVWFLPLIALFGFRGAESSFNRELVTFYYAFSLITFVLLSIGEFAQFLSRKNEKIYKAIGWFGSIIINPEMSILYNKKTNDYYTGFKWAKKTKSLLWLSIIFFSLLGILAVVNNTFLLELPHLTQQILPLGEAILEVEPAGTEIFGLVLIISINLYFWKYIQKKTGFDNAVYWVIAIPTSILFGVFAYGLPLHFFRYPASDQSLIAVAIFWFIATFLIIIFANIYIVWLFKDMNNLFLYLNGKYADERVVVITILIISFIFLIGIAIWLIKKEKKKFKLSLNLGQNA